MVSQVTLTNPTINSGTAVKLHVDSITYAWKNLVGDDPSNSSYSNVETIFNGWENPVININFTLKTECDTTGFMTWPLWNQFLKSQYLGTSSTRTLLSINTGTSTLFASYAASTSNTAVTSIPVQIKTCNVNLNANDSRDAYAYTISAQLLETK